MTNATVHRPTAPERLVPGTLHWQVYEYEHRQRYAQFADRCSGLHVLDAACGVGYGTAMLADAGAAAVVGVDVSQEAVDYAKQHFARPCSKFLRCDVQNTPFPDRRFDAVISFETIEHVTSPRAFIAEVARLLRPGGLFVCSTPNRDYLYKGNAQNPYHLSEMSFDEFRSIFTTRFSVEETYHQSPTPSYRRHLDLLETLKTLRRPLVASAWLKVENAVRKKLDHHAWDLADKVSPLARMLPGDIVLEPIQHPCPEHLTFVFVGRLKVNG